MSLPRPSGCMLLLLATGRPPVALRTHIDALGLALPCICCHGAALLTLAPGAPPEVEWPSPLDASALAAVAPFTDAHGVCLSYSSAERSVAVAGGAAQEGLLARYEALEGVAQARVRRGAWAAAAGPPQAAALPRRAAASRAAADRAAASAAPRAALAVAQPDAHGDRRAQEPAGSASHVRAEAERGKHSAHRAPGDRQRLGPPARRQRVRLVA